MGFFSNKKDKEFKSDLKDCASDFDHIIDSLDPDGNTEIQSRVMEMYLEKNPSNAGLPASDFYFMELWNIMKQLTLDALIPRQHSLIMFVKTDEFLKENSKYTSEITTSIMAQWKKIVPITLGKDGSVKMSDLL